MALSQHEVQATYQVGAEYDDRVMQLDHLIGFRIDAYRARDVHRFRLQRGGCVVELGCGTGLNVPLLIEQIGAEGRLIGVDLTPEMLACARERVERCGWKNTAVETHQ